MPNADEKQTPIEHPKKHRPTGDYPVGWCRAPIDHRFGPGNKASAGRKKGTKNRKLVIEEILFEPITVREGDAVKQMPKLEALLKKMLSQALAGDQKSAFAIFAIAQKEGLLTPAQEEAVENLSENDIAIMEDVKKRLGIAKPEQPGAAPGQPRRGSPPEPPQADACQTATGLPKFTTPCD